MFGGAVQVLEVAAGQVVVRDNLDLALANLLDGDVVTEVVGAALDLDAVLEELLEGGDVEDLVASGLLSVDDELRRVSAAHPSPRHVSCLQRASPHTLRVTFWALPAFFCCNLAYCVSRRLPWVREAPTAKRVHLVHTVWGAIAIGLVVRGRKEVKSYAC